MTEQEYWEWWYSEELDQYIKTKRGETMREATVKEIKDYFGSKEYPEVMNKEILDMKREDSEGYDEIKKLLGEQLDKEENS